jgi:hypothetical protein
MLILHYLPVILAQQVEATLDLGQQQAADVGGEVPSKEATTSRLPRVRRTRDSWVTQEGMWLSEPALQGR